LLTFSYTDREGRRTRRKVEPHGLLVRAPLWYVIAWDSRRNAPRLFRADRIRRPSVIEETFLPRPHALVTRVCPDARAAFGGGSNGRRRRPARPG
jgi:predicted DNA-binding transcriptional regulator YafY